jgi:hypothetical protein
LKIEKFAQLSIENKKEDFICATLCLIFSVGILASNSSISYDRVNSKWMSIQNRI